LPGEDGRSDADRASGAALAERRRTGSASHRQSQLSGDDGTTAPPTSTSVRHRLALYAGLAHYADLQTARPARVLALGEDFRLAWAQDAFVSR